MTEIKKIIPELWKDFAEKIIKPDESFADKKWRFCCAFYKKLGIDLKKLLEISSDEHLTKNKTKNKTTPDHWNEFLEKIIKPKKSAAHNGWRWLCAISYLVDIRHPKDIRKDLPVDHPLKLDHARFIKLETLAKKLKQKLGNPKEIEKIDFSGLHFENKMDFSNFIFPIDTDFSNATFSKDVLFNNSIFWETADFESTTFHEETSHSKETAKFRNTVFAKIANFRNATFWGYANFKGAKLKGRAFFQDAIFKYHAPRFYDAKFNNEITWAGIKLPNFDKALVDEHEKVGNTFKSITCDECTKGVKCSKPIKCKEVIKKNHRRRIEENQNSYENTAILLEGTKKYHDQHFFFREEMRCRRWLRKNPFDGLVFGIYEELADYGYGIVQAFSWWAGHIFFWAYILFFTVFKDKCPLSERLSCSAFTSLSNAHSFFLSKSERLTNCSKMIHDTSSLDLIWALETISGALFLFLLLLTLRTRFRLK